MSELFVQENSMPTAIPARAKSNTALGSTPKIAKPGANPPVFAPKSRIPRSTMTANIETNASPTSLLEEDIELIEESGLLEIEEESKQASNSDASADSDNSSSSDESEHIVELTQSILIDDVEGNPKAAAGAPLSLAPEALDEEIILDDEILSEEEIAAKSESTRVIAMSDIEEVEEIEDPLLAAKPQRQIGATDKVEALSTGTPISQRRVTTTDKVEALSGLPISQLTTHEKAVGSGLAQYSEGKPDHMLVTPRSGTAPTNRTWPKIAIPALVFIAGISGGVILASQSGTSSTSAAAPPTQQIQAAPPNVPDVAPLAQIEVAPLVIEEPTPDTQPEIAENSPDPSDNTSVSDDSALVIGDTKTAETATVIAKPKAQPTPKVAAKVQPIAKAIVKTTPTPKPKSKPAVKQAIVAKDPGKSGDPGILMLGAKPPSSIFIDGKATGLTTPQRSLKLSPGTHKITLVNKELGIRDTFSVTMKSGKQIKRIRNNTSKIK